MKGGDQVDEFWDMANKFSSQLYTLLISLTAILTVLLKPWQYTAARREERANEIEAAKLAEREAVREENERLVEAIREELKPIENQLNGLTGTVGKISATQDGIATKVGSHAERIARLEERTS